LLRSLINKHTKNILERFHLKNVVLFLEIDLKRKHI